MLGTDAGPESQPDSQSLVSVITVCRNSAPTIRTTIESVLAQTYEPIEYIVVDGESSDATLDIVRECAPRFDGRLRWISEPDAGIYDAMNKGVRLATGAYVAFINSDDWYLEDGISRLVAAIGSGGGSDISYGGMMQPTGAADGSARCISPGWMSLDPMMRTMPACHEAILFRRDLHARFGDYSLEYRVASDYEFLLRCLAGGATTARVDAPIMFFAHGGASDDDAASVEREYASIRVKYGASPASERLRSERSILNGRVYRLLCGLPLIGPLAQSAYERLRSRRV